MPRKLAEQLLPPLRELFPDFNGFPESGHRLHLATDLLGRAARSLQKQKNQSFYSMREAARFLWVPPSTMSGVYRNLENEGLIVRMRGSRTILLGRTSQSSHPARSIVSIPIILPGMINSCFARSFCARISEELWRHHFVANLMLCTLAESFTNRFTQRLLKQSDAVIWLFPYRDLKETILTLQDHCIQNVLLSSVENILLPADYIMDWTPTYRQAIKYWKADNIHHVVLTKASEPRLQKIIEGFLQLLKEEGLSFTLTEPSAFDLQDKVEAKLKKGMCACAVLEHDLSQQFCNRESVIMARLMTRCRVLFGRGMVSAPYFSKRDFKADIIGFSGDEVARRVARDLGRRHSKPNVKPVRLVPHWRPQISLSEMFV